jgi:hypothetical protein
MIAKKPVPDVIGDGTNFSEKIMRNRRSGAAIRFNQIGSRSSRLLKKGLAAGLSG